MADGVDVPLNLEVEQQLASPLSGHRATEEFEAVQRDGAFRLRAPPVLSHEQLRSPLATPGKSPSTSANRSASIPAAAVSNSEAEEDPLPRRRPRRLLDKEFVAAIQHLGREPLRAEPTDRPRRAARQRSPA